MFVDNKKEGNLGAPFESRGSPSDPFLLGGIYEDGKEKC